MKAVRLKGPASIANLCVVEESAPQPKADEVLVRLRASSINPHDDFVVRGLIPSVAGRIPLSDGAGEVVACGERVTELQVGDSVMSMFWPHWQSGEITTTTRRDIPGELIDGYAREYACMPAQTLTPIPKGYSYAEAATLPCAGTTAWRGLVTRGKVKPGDTVLIMGSGSVSLFALQFAKAAGARVIATSSSDAKLEKLKQLGADELINYKTTPDWGERAKALTDGRGVDHVIEVGGPATLAQSMAACRFGGHIAMIGVLSGFAGELLIPALFSAQLRVSGISVGSKADQEDMIRAIEVNQLKPVIDRTYNLDQLPAAFEYYQTKQHFGKVSVSI